MLYMFLLYVLLYITYHFLTNVEGLKKRKHMTYKVQLNRSLVLREFE